VEEINNHVCVATTVGAVDGQRAARLATFEQARAEHVERPARKRQMSILNSEGTRATGTIMLKTVALLFALIGVVPAAFAEAPVKTIPPEEAPNFHGQLVTVKGVVSADTTSGRGNRFLNMGGTYPNQAFTGWVPTKNAGAFSILPNVTGKTCSITGQVQPYKGKPEIVLNSPSQVKCE